MKTIDFNQQSAKQACSMLLLKADQLAQQSVEEAKKNNDEIFQILHSLYMACDEKSFEVQHQVQRKREQYLHVSQKQVDLTKAFEEQQNKLHQSQRILAKTVTHIDQLQKQLEQENKNLAQLHDKKRQLEERRLDLAKFFWVPFYNYYLIGRTIDDAVSQIPLVEEKAKNLNKLIKKITNKRNQAQKNKDEHNAQLTKINTQLQQVSDQQNDLIDQELQLSQDLAIVERASRLLTEFSDATANAKERSRGTHRFLKLLSNDERINETNGALLISYRHGIEMLGTILDKYVTQNRLVA